MTRFIRILSPIEIISRPRMDINGLREEIDKERTSEELEIPQALPRDFAQHNQQTEDRHSCIVGIIN